MFGAKRQIFQTVKVTPKRVPPPQGVGGCQNPPPPIKRMPNEFGDKVGRTPMHELKLVFVTPSASSGRREEVGGHRAARGRARPGSGSASGPNIGECWGGGEGAVATATIMLLGDTCTRPMPPPVGRRRRSPVPASLAGPWFAQNQHL